MRVNSSFHFSKFFPRSIVSTLGGVSWGGHWQTSWNCKLCMFQFLRCLPSSLWLQSNMMISALVYNFKQVVYLSALFCISSAVSTSHFPTSTEFTLHCSIAVYFFLQTFSVTRGSFVISIVLYNSGLYSTVCYGHLSSFRFQTACCLLTIFTSSQLHNLTS